MIGLYFNYQIILTQNEPNFKLNRLAAHAPKYQQSTEYSPFKFSTVFRLLYIIQAKSIISFSQSFVFLDSFIIFCPIIIFLPWQYELIRFDRLYQYLMTVRAQDQLKTFEQLSAESGPVGKACTLGVIIDSTCAYFDQTKKKYVLKIKLVDDTFNTNIYNPHQKFSYMTVFFYGEKIESLPSVRCLGDLLYMRRFSFGRYNESFQGHFIEAQYCNWALVKGDTESTNPEEYQTSRNDMRLGDEKYLNLTGRIRQLRFFAQQYLKSTSVLSILPTGITTKDTDLIVQVNKKQEDGGYLLLKGKEQLFLGPLASYAEPSTFAKLRSVARIVSHNKKSYIVPNNFTSLIAIPSWSYDAKLAQKTNNIMEEQADFSTPLSQLLTKPLSEVQNKKYFVNVEVASVSTDQFMQALKFYDEKKNQLHDTQKKDASPIYKLNLVCLDDSLSKSNKFAEIWIYSYDGKCNDFVNRVRLEDLNEFSSYSEEGKYFNERIEQLLNAEFVRITVEVLSDGKNGRILRALHIA